ncbi:hypothetical protein [Umezawaea sp. Da 62-37]|uniref:hypothetical protein n=1 Tax=Umezawaea sp. Da 62-37 TaxID=3075927 RepID=UPI0028F714F6|nr:hypothetical protein [Umezawaea sp. Da 62-37]WNV82905.1 hypothetical protein RM788_32525 [Umezawaea sp. Da 62-37]
MDEQIPDRAFDGDQAHLAALLWAVADIHPMRRAHPDWAYSCMEQLLLHRGHWYSPAPFPAHRERGDERHCYANATRHSRAYHLIYVEGYALGPHGLLYEHAWCARPDGTIEDPTWSDGAGLAYVGIPFTASYIAEHEQRRGTAVRLLLDPHLNDWEPLRSGWPAIAESAAANR